MNKDDGSKNKITPTALIASLGSAQDAYATFQQEKNKLPNFFFAFFEGLDAAYYGMIIRMFRNDVEPIKCHNKEGVKKVYKKLSNEPNFNNYKTGFFIDKDFDLNVDEEKNDDIFVTKGYSIENYYVTKESFERVLTYHIGLKRSDMMFSKIVDEYTKAQENFSNAILEFNGWYCALRRRYGDSMGHLDLDNNKKVCKELIDYDIPNRKFHPKFSHSKYKTFFPDAGVVSTKEVIEARNYIAEDLVLRSRGKEELKFMIDFLNDLCTKFKGKRPDLHTESFGIDPLNHLVNCAEVEERLKNYIKTRLAS